MKDIDRQGIASIVEQAVKLAGDGTAGIHVSFDMDVCDPPIAPGVGTPVKGGLDYREAHMVMEIVADSGLLTSLDLVEVNPTLDVRNATAQLGDRAGAVGARDEDSVSASASISSSISTSRTSEYGFSISRVRGRSRSSSADSDGTPEKMITGTRRASRSRRRGPIRGAA